MLYRRDAAARRTLFVQKVCNKYQEFENIMMV